MKKTFFVTALQLSVALSVLASSQASASSYEALCENDADCVVSVSEGMLSIGPLSIPSSSIISWGETEAKSKRKPQLCLFSLTACALSIFHDYRYYVEYADNTGIISKKVFRFVNDTPAKQLARELTSMTNLASGQTSDVAMRSAEKKRAEADHQKMLTSLNCAPTLKPYKCSYDAYLDANPGAKAWAETNPSLAKKQMIQMKAIEIMGRE